MARYLGPCRDTPEVLLTLNAAVRATAATPSLVEAYEALGNTIMTSESPQAFAAFMRSETRKWTDIVRLAGLTAS